MNSNWSRESWRDKEVVQMPSYLDDSALKKVEAELKAHLAQAEASVAESGDDCRARDDAARLRWDQDGDATRFLSVRLGP
mgnify:CR=1 FL=1